MRSITAAELGRGLLTANPENKVDELGVFNRAGAGTDGEIIVGDLFSSVFLASLTVGTREDIVPTDADSGLFADPKSGLVVVCLSFGLAVF